LLIDEWQIIRELYFLHHNPLEGLFKVTGMLNSAR